MGQFRVSAADVLSALGPKGAKIYAALRQGIEGYDFDSGWVAKPTGGIFNHGLTTVPRFVSVQGSDHKDGSDYLTEHPSSVTAQQVVVGGTKAYYRVLAER